MRTFDDRDLKHAEAFFADLVGRRRRDVRDAPAPASALPPREPPVQGSLDPALLFDGVVHRGMDPNAAFAAEAEQAEGHWETVALPRSPTPPQLLPEGALIVFRALGDGRLAYLKVLGRDVQVHQLYGGDGCIRADVLVLRPRGAVRQPAIEDVGITEEDEDARSADSVGDDSPLALDPSYNSDDDKVPSVWALSDKIRELVKTPRSDKASRELLEQAAERQLRTAVLYEHVTSAHKAVAGSKDESVLMLYVILFPGEARDNTGLKDLNDNVLGYSRHDQYIRARQDHMRKIFNKAPFSLAGQDYKTALIAANERQRKNVVFDTRKIFDDRLWKLDAALREELLKLLPHAEKDPRYKDAARTLRQTLEKKPDYRFDIYYGLSIHMTRGRA